MVKFTPSSTVAAARRDPDVRLMLKVKAGSHAAFEELVQRYQDRVRGIIAHLVGSSAHAEALTPEVFLRVSRARRSYVVSAKFATWLFTIVNNVVSNARRTLARRREIGLGTSDMAESYDFLVESRREQSPAHAAETAETREIIPHCIQRLNDRQRTAITLCDMDNLSYAEVADAIGISSAAAKSLIHRGRMTLKQMLEPHVQRGNLL